MISWNVEIRSNLQIPWGMLNPKHSIATAIHTWTSHLFQTFSPTLFLKEALRNYREAREGVWKQLQLCRKSEDNSGLEILLSPREFNNTLPSTAGSSFNVQTNYTSKMLIPNSLLKLLWTSGRKPISYIVILGSFGEIKCGQRVWCPLCTCRRKFERYRLYETVICFEFQLWSFGWNFLKVTAKSNLKSNSFIQLLEHLLCSRPCARERQ